MLLSSKAHIKVIDTHSYRPQVLPMDSGAQKFPIRNSGHLISGSYRYRYRSDIIGIN